ncbi:MAG: tRNA pseudouridine(38-40) synthase TruA, partial [Acidobacteria bacterium]
AFQSAGSDVATTVRTISVSRIADCGLRSDCGSLDCGLRSDCGSWIDDSMSTDESVRASIRNHNPQSALLVYEIAGDGFLRHMVRAIVGTLVEIGRGRRPVEWMTAVLASRDRAAAGQTAPALGLFLARVGYDDTP